MAKHKETLGFNNFEGYYGSIRQGYGGFDWGDMDYLNATYWQNVKTDWCDTGYQNVIGGAGEALAQNRNGYTTVAFFQTANSSVTFNLKSMVAASAWETSQPFQFNSYTYVQGQGLTLKASDTVYLSQTAQTINFAKIGKPGDFKNVSQVTIISGSGKYGNTCSYGPYGYTLGNELAFDSMKVSWNGKIPKGPGELISTGLAPHGHEHRSHPVAGQFVFPDAHHGTTANAHIGAPGFSNTQAGFHGELMTLGDHGSGALTARFQLPAIEHFGS